MSIFLPIFKRTYQKCLRKGVRGPWGTWGITKPKLPLRAFHGLWSQKKVKHCIFQQLWSTTKVIPVKDDRLGKSRVLVLAGIELIFFIVASMGLRFGFVLKTVDHTGMF